MEAVKSSEMLVDFYGTTWCHVPEDSALHRKTIISPCQI
jgi:hypothetical protein